MDDAWCKRHSAAALPGLAAVLLPCCSTICQQWKEHDVLALVCLPYIHTCSHTPAYRHVGCGLAGYSHEADSDGTRPSRGGHAPPPNSGALLGQAAGHCGPGHGGEWGMVNGRVRGRWSAMKGRGAW